MGETILFSKKVIGESAEEPPSTRESDQINGRHHTERIARLIRDVRKRANLSQTDLAGRLGISQGRISELERGQGVMGPTYAMLARIADACDAKLIVRFADKCDIRREHRTHRYEIYSSLLVRKLATALRACGLLAPIPADPLSELQCLTKFAKEWEISLENSNLITKDDGPIEVMIKLRRYQ